MGFLFFVKIFYLLMPTDWWVFGGVIADKFDFLGGDFWVTQPDASVLSGHPFRCVPVNG